MSECAHTVESGQLWMKFLAPASDEAAFVVCVRQRDSKHRACGVYECDVMYIDADGMCRITIPAELEQWQHAGWQLVSA